MNINRIISLLVSFVILFSISLLAHSQEKVSIGGDVFSRVDNSPVEAAAVILRDGQGNVITHTMTSSKGRFIFSLSEEKEKYSVEISMIGYFTYQKEITHSKGKKYYNLGVINLKLDNTLQAAVVEAPSHISEIPDGFVYSVYDDTLAKKKDMISILERLPLMDRDENNEPIYFGVSKNITYLVNGKRTNLIGGKANSNMKLVKGEHIKNIEMITSPPPNYANKDLVINIITEKESLFEGVTIGASLSGNAKITHYSLTPSVNVTLSWKKLSLTINGAYTLSNSILNNTTYSLTDYYSTEGVVDPEKRFESNRTSNSGSNYYNISASAFYRINQNSQLRFMGGFGINKDFSNSSRETKYADTEKKDVTNSTKDNNKGNYYNLSAEYSNGAIRGREYGFGYHFNYKDTKGLSDISTLLDSTPSSLQKGERGSHYLEQGARANLNIPVNKKGQFISSEAEYYLVNNNDSYDRYYYDSFQDLWVENVNNSYYSKIQINRVTIKAGYTFPLWDKTSLTLNLQGRYYNQGGYVDKNHSNKISHSVYSFIPSARFNYNPKIGCTITLGYYRSLMDPTIWNLNPYVDNTDSLFISMGNPNLKSVASDNVNISYMQRIKKNTITLNFSYSHTKDPIRNYSYITDNGITVNTYKNFGINNNFSAKLTYRYSFSRKIDASLILNADSYLFNIDGKKSCNNSWSCSLSSQYKVSPRFSIKGDIKYRPINVLSYQTIRNYYLITPSITFSGRTKNQKFNYSIDIQDFHRLKTIEKSASLIGNYHYLTQSTTDGISISFNVSYSFGQIK